MFHYTYVGSVADEFTKEDLLVGVEGVDDEAEELVDLRLESEGLCVCHLYIRHWRTSNELHGITEKKKERTAEK